MSGTALKATSFSRIVRWAVLAAGFAVPAQAAEKWLSHPALHPLSVSKPGAVVSPSYFVDATKGDDSHPGTISAPWQSVSHALKQLKPGDTLYLRGGNYFENVYCAVAGTEQAPITIRAYPGEQVILDGGIREFQEQPQDAWEPVTGGAVGEYRSKQAYKNIRDVLGLFGDSNIGLQTYWHREDLQSDNEQWIVTDKVVQPVYCGPGLWYDKLTGHIHVRLAHTHLTHPEVTNYQGETDPRRLPLVVAPFGSAPLFVDQAMHVRFQDLVIRGGGHNSVVLQFGVDVTFDNVTVFAGTYGVRSRSTGPFKMVDSAIHGCIPPWGWRSENSLYTYTPLRYDPFVPPPASEPGRNIARLPTHALLVTEGSYEFEVFYYPFNHDWDISRSEFTDGHDGVYLSGRNIRFHENLVDNIQDDAIYLSAPSTDFTDQVYIYQNLITRALMAFGCHSRGGPNGSIYIYRNVCDLRQGVLADRPTPAKPQGTLSAYHIFLVHGRELLGIESLNFYQNTMIAPGRGPAFAHRMLASTSPRTPRRVFNNLLVYLEGVSTPSAPLMLREPLHDTQIDGNLHWSVGEKPLPDNFLAAVRDCPASKHNLEKYPAGWEAHSLVAEPRFTEFHREAGQPNDYRLKEDSPARGAGIALPLDFEDPLRKSADARPDIGAIPFGGPSPKFGRQGRISLPINGR